MPSCFMTFCSAVSVISAWRNLESHFVQETRQWARQQKQDRGPHNGWWERDLLSMFVHDTTSARPKANFATNYIMPTACISCFTAWMIGLILFLRALNYFSFLILFFYPTVLFSSLLPSLPFSLDLLFPLTLMKFSYPMWAEVPVLETEEGM